MNNSNDVKKRLIAVSKNRDITDLKNDLVKLFTEELSDLWKKKDTKFLEKLAYDIAQQTLNIESAPSKEVRDKCKTNLEHLKATFQGDMVTRRIKLTWRGRKLFSRIIKVIIESVLIMATNKLSKVES